MAIDAAQATLLGLPTELRMMIFHHVLHEPAVEQSMVCCFDHDHSEEAHAKVALEDLRSRMRNLAHVLGLNKPLRSEVQAMRFPSWQMDFCVSAIYDPDYYLYSEGRFLGPSEGVKQSDADWSFVPCFVITQSATTDQATMLESLLKYVPQIRLFVNVGLHEPRTGDDIYAEDSYRWFAIDNIRCFINVLNKCERVTKLDVRLRLVNQDDDTALHNQYLGGFKHLRDDITLKINTEYYPARSPKLDEASFYSQMIADTLDRLQSSQRSKHFPETSAPSLLEQWCKLQRWANDVFGYISRRILQIEPETMPCIDQFATLWDHEEREVKRLLRHA